LEDSGQSVPRAPKPHTILLKANIRLTTWAGQFELAGVRWEDYNVDEKEKKHVEHAEAVGRQAYAVRKDVADSGTQVFGKDGLHNVSMSTLIRELVLIYQKVDIHLRRRRDGDPQMGVLVVSFSNEGEATNNAAALALFLKFMDQSAWEHAHIWANPPQLDDKKIVHTVNLAHRLESREAHISLGFADGLWATTNVTH
jgi:hypothetical protein